MQSIGVVLSKDGDRRSPMHPPHRFAGGGIRNALPANNEEREQTRLHIPATEIRPGEAQMLALENKEGAGKAGCLLHPQPHARNKKHMSLVTTGTPERSGFPCAMVLTVSFALAPETGLSCLRRPRDA